MYLNQANRELEDVTPAWVTRLLRRLRRPQAKPLRLVRGFSLVAGAFLAPLPVFGVEMLPIGLLLLAEDIPVLRKPTGLFVLWAVRQWKRLRAAWLKWRGR